MSGNKMREMKLVGERERERDREGETGVITCVQKRESAVYSNPRITDEKRRFGTGECWPNANC